MTHPETRRTADAEATALMSAYGASHAQAIATRCREAEGGDRRAWDFWTETLAALRTLTTQQAR